MWTGDDALRCVVLVVVMSRRGMVHGMASPWVRLDAGLGDGDVAYADAIDLLKGSFDKIIIRTSHGCFRPGKGSALRAPSFDTEVLGTEERAARNIAARTDRFWCGCEGWASEVDGIGFTRGVLWAAGWAQDIGCHKCLLFQRNSCGHKDSVDCF
jgi:hypothetical protein